MLSFDWTALLALPLFLTGCGLFSTGEPRIDRQEFHPSLNVDLAQMTQTSSGLYLRDLEAGTGEIATVGRTVELRYTLWLPNGARIDTNEPDGPLLVFAIGEGRVIQGFEEGVTGMQVGGRRQIIVPPSLGYGNQPIGPIPANSILVFELSLVGLR
jgi:FKBP-type peptidyl-prolyl cis-trans isomerase FkpA